MRPAGWTAGRAVAVVLLAVLAGCTPAPGLSGDDPETLPPVDRPAGTRWVSTTGDDTGTGTTEDPWRTLTHAFQRLIPGDTLVVGGGTYREQVRDIEVRSGTPEHPITVEAAPGEDAVVQGLLWLADADHWHLRGIDVTWDEETGDHEEHMVKLTDGTGWSFTGAEVWGARSFAAILVATSGGSEPSDWLIAGNCIHSTVPSNDTNQDHLIYVNSGLRSGPGTIEGNLLFDAPNGNGVKLGGARPDEGGATGVTVRRNTIAGTAQGVLIAWTSQDNLVEDNVIAEVGAGYGLIRGYRLDGPGNRAQGNTGWGAAVALDNDGGHRGVADLGDNRLVEDAAFEQPGTCDGYEPTADLGEAGHGAAPGSLTWGGADR